MKIGFLTIATNKYIDFVDRLYESADKHMCTGIDVTYFLFTDRLEFVPKTKRTHKVLHIKHESWPNITLKRYHTFCKYADELSSMDYLYYCDADMLFVDTVGDEIISPKVVTIHPGFYATPITRFPYENRPISTAFVSPKQKMKYYAGGFNGGSSSEFLKMATHITQTTDIDLQNGIVAKWHDESHLNHYYNVVTKPTLELSPSYCFPETWRLPFPKKLLALVKNHSEYRK